MESGGFDAAGEQAFVAHGQLILLDQLQELGMAELMADGFLQANIERLRGTGETQAGQCGAQGSFIG